MNHCGFCVLQSHCEPPGEGQVQGGDPPQGWAAGRDRAGVLQLRLSQRLPPGLHPSQGRLGGRAAVQVRLVECCFDQQAIQ